MQVTQMDVCMNIKVVISFDMFPYPILSSSNGDLGTFKLELAVHPLMNFLGKNIDWAKMLAEEKNITILTEDSTAPNTQDQCRGETSAISNRNIPI